VPGGIYANATFLLATPHSLHLPLCTHSRIFISKDRGNTEGEIFFQTFEGVSNLECTCGIHFPKTWNAHVGYKTFFSFKGKDLGKDLGKDDWFTKIVHDVTLFQRLMLCLHEVLRSRFSTWRQNKAVSILFFKIRFLFLL
jgi:hypothetical protein